VNALHQLIVERIRASGPITAAEFIETALYDPQHGYYSTAVQRSGRGGDFFTSVDVGSLFGELIAVQLAEMWTILGGATFDLVEAAAGNGRLTRDILDTAARDYPDFYDALRVSLVERSAAARAAQAGTLGPHAHKLTFSGAELPHAFEGALVANELLDAFPVHVVVAAPEGLREIYVGEQAGALREELGPISNAAISRYFERLGVTLRTGARAEVNLASVEWIRTASQCLARGFLTLIDYGHPARELFSELHASGTLSAYRSHQRSDDWLASPGDMDLTSHVDLTSIRVAAEEEGLQALGAVDQLYFLTSLGLAERLPTGDDVASISRRLAARTLMMPGGLGSTMKTIVFSRGVGMPALRGLSGGRLT
jgi:SAM-dependent MidA family methyltransferase